MGQFLMDLIYSFRKEGEIDRLLCSHRHHGLGQKYWQGNRSSRAIRAALGRRAALRVGTRSDARSLEALAAKLS